jgi:hypothetical protein
MARKATKLQEPEPEQIQEPHPAVARCCVTCRHWKPRPNWPVIGECMPSRAGLGQPLVTLDWAICSNHEYAEQYL